MKEVMTGPLPRRRAHRLARQDDEARRVVRLVLDVLAQDVEAVDLGREARGERAALRIAELGDVARRARRIGRDLGGDAELADDAAALAERVDVALHHLEVARAWRRGTPRSWWCTGRKCSPMMERSEVGSR